MITEYTPVQFKGLQPDGKTPWEFWVVKLGEDLYYHNYEIDYIKMKNLDWAAHIANEKFALEIIGFLQNFYDENGKARPENAGKVIPPLVGLAEAAEMLEWDKRKLATYQDRAKKYRQELAEGKRTSLPPDILPEPIRVLASGPIWTYKQIQDYRDARK